MKKIQLVSLLIVALFAAACSQPVKEVRSATTQAIKVDSSLDAIQDEAYIEHLAPTRAELDKIMDVQLGYATQDMWVGSPECPMLNWATDALWEAAKKVYPGTVDIAIVNMGGMRCSWVKGPITRGNVFDLMPFENELVVLTLKGCDVIDLCESFARYGAQGVAGMRVTIIDGKLADVTVAGKAVNPKAEYTIATSDYLSGGTDHMTALTRAVDCWKSELKIRDLYEQAVLEQDTLRVALDGRMTIKP